MRIPSLAGVRRRLFRARVGLAHALLQSAARDEALAGSPAAFPLWLARRRGTRFRGHPGHWHVEEASPDAPRLAVVLHVHYPELVPGILRLLGNLPERFDLFLTDSSGTDAPLPPLDLPLLGRFTRFEVENRGRDILPLVSLVNSGLLDPYDVVLKLHTKKSPWRESHDALDGSGDEWRDTLLQEILGDRSTADRVLAAFDRDPDLGFVVAGDSIAGSEHWGANEAGVADLLRRVELDRTEHLTFPAGSIYWARGFALRALRALRLDAEDFPPERGQDDGTTAHAVERVLGVLATEAGFRIASPEHLGEPAAGEPVRRARVIPFYLPQYHRFPENDRWWGPGFTDWANVAKGKPNFPGHEQPLLPAELGFYDLESDRVRKRQTELATRAGISGFMYYHYWFAGRPLMRMPLERLVESELDQPFSVMWANEDWTRTWDGRADDVLIAQEFESAPANGFIDDVLPLLRDPRYIRVDGAALLAVYRPGAIPDFAAVLADWRERARAAGAGELHVLGVDVGGVFQGYTEEEAERAGLDGLLGFPPHNHRWEWRSQAGSGIVDTFRGRYLEYRGMADAAIDDLRSGRVGPRRSPGVMAGFDNTARRQDTADIWYGANPFTFRRWLRAAVLHAESRPEASPLVFVNAWNEWAESAVLEPTERYGSLYLQAVGSALARPERRPRASG
jgi:lipopolysaccharide biosynthesis protein